ncbi:MAG: hypothetical protein FJX51_02175, partial [Alphaproteobacteria bacterium]|nr:hypothetical protein [Alphaproteobacteria bacterium]
MPDLDKLFKPQSIAFVGVSAERPLVASRTYRNMKRLGYKGRLYPIHPRAESFEGDKCYPSLSALPEVPDMAFIAVGVARTEEIVLECARLGVRAIEVGSAGYAEAGEEGRAREARLKAIVAKADMALCGPNNMGFINALDDVIAWPPSTTVQPKKGGVAVVTQSGSVGIVLSQDERKLGLAYLVTAGNETGLTAADYLAYFVEDPRVTVVMLFLEALREPEKFARAAARARQLGKPVVALKVGRSEDGARAVSAHTGAIAGDAALYDAFFEAHGVLVAHELDALQEMAVLLSAYPAPPRNPHVIPITLSGGEAALLADLAGAHKVSLPPLPEALAAALQPHFPEFLKPRNPLDAFGLGWDEARVEQILTLLAADPTYGTIAIAFDAPASGAADGPYARQVAAMCGRLKDKTGAKFVFFNNMAAGGRDEALLATLNDLGIPFLSGMGHGFAAIGAWSARAVPRPPVPAVTAMAPALRRAAETVETLDEPARFEMLRAAGVPMAACQVVRSAEEAVAAAAKLGGPVAMKASAAHILHKTELGLVRLGLAGADAIKAAYGELSTKVPGMIVFVHP